MNFQYIFLIGIVFTTGCSTIGPPEPLPVRPVLSCENCSGLTYYGPQQAPAPDPRVQMASTITKGIVGVTGILVGGNVATSISSDLAKGAVGALSTNSIIERSSTTTNNTSDTSITDRTNTSVTDTTNNTSVTDRTNTSVTDRTNNTSVTNTTP